MKIQLERTLPTCPPQLRCVACSQPFKVEKIRSLLCDRDHLIQGDLCRTCRRATDLPQTLKTAEAIQRPQFYDWWFKRLTILSAATQEIEQARFAAKQCRCQTVQSLRIRFQSDDR
jgi:hypothetical protein